MGENTGVMKGWGSFEEKKNKVRSRSRGRKVLREGVVRSLVPTVVRMGVG